MENTRNTIQKKIIFNTLRDIDGHPTAKEVYEKLHSKHATISRATVFRVLNNLANAGHINRIRILDNSDIYDYITKLVPEYKVYLRHHNVSGTETVLYAVI